MSTPGIMGPPVQWIIGVGAKRKFWGIGAPDYHGTGFGEVAHHWRVLMGNIIF